VEQQQQEEEQQEEEQQQQEEAEEEEAMEGDITSTVETDISSQVKDAVEAMFVVQPEEEDEEEERVGITPTDNILTEGEAEELEAKLEGNVQVMRVWGDACMG
jgi:hypothetical protein